MKNRKLILFGAGEYGLKALEEYGTERIAFFCDSNAGQLDGEYHGIPVISYEGLKSVFKDYDLIISVNNLVYLREIRLRLDRDGIPYNMYGKDYSIVYENDEQDRVGETIHFFGRYPEISIDFCDDDGAYYTEYRVQQSIEIILYALNTRNHLIDGKYVDFYLYVGDHPFHAYRTLKKMGLNRLMAYSTLETLKKQVIAFPDYRTYVSDEACHYSETRDECRKASQKKWSDRRMYWRGSASFHYTRQLLLDIGEKNPDRFFFQRTDGEEKLSYLPMTEQVDYKYLIDVQGWGWTDRVKVLLQLGRPVFLVNRAYKEWYFEYMKPMVHYVPVKEDLSDLVEMYDYMESHPEIYDNIVENAKAFVEEYFSPEHIIDEIIDRIF